MTYEEIVAHYRTSNSEYWRKSKVWRPTELV